MEWTSFFILVIAGSLWLWIAIRMLTVKKPLSHDRTVHVDQGVNMSDVAGCRSIQGSRPHMEDTYQVKKDLLGDGRVSYFGVFDGHGGDKASRFASDHLHDILAKQGNLVSDSKQALITAFEELDARWLAKANGLDDGSTAVVALVIGSQVYVANAGDSRCVMGRTSQRDAIELSHDHKPDRPDERMRIEASGGRVKHFGTWRVEGVLAVSRAIGDRRLKQWVVATPEIEQRTLTEGEFLILASDGLWDVISSQEAVDIAQRSRVTARQTKNSFVNEAADDLTITAYTRGSMDNITSLVVDLDSVMRPRAT